MRDFDFKKVFEGGLAIEPNIIQTVKIHDMIKQKSGFNLILDAIVENGKFDFDDNNTLAVKKLFAYFNGVVSDCEKLEMNLNKGILLVGPVGTGKTDLMESFQGYCSEVIQMNGFQMYTAAEIVDGVKVNGMEFMREFSENSKDNIQRIKTCYVDDIASKNEKAKNYGNDANVIEDFISIRYNIFKRYRKLTHFSTNIYPIDLKKLYDARIIDRLIEMCNILELTGPSRRK